MKKYLLISACSLLTAVCSLSAQTQNAPPSSFTDTDGGKNMVKAGAVEFGEWASFSGKSFGTSWLGFGAAYERLISSHLTAQLEGDYQWQSSSFGAGTNYSAESTAHYLTFTPEVRYFFKKSFDGFYVGANVSQHFISSSTTSNSALIGNNSSSEQFTALALALGGYFHITPKIYANVGGNVGFTISTPDGGQGINIWNGIAMFGYRF